MEQNELVANYNIKIFGNSCIVTTKQKDNCFIAKTVKLESLIKVFQNTSAKIESPILPLNTLRYQEEGTQVAIILYHEPVRFNATYSSKVYENCIRPGVIIKYTLSVKDGIEKTYTICGTRCFGVLDSPIMFSKNTQLYGLPFPNISSEGYVCWGGNNMGGELKALTGLNSYVLRLFNSPFSGHGFSSQNMRNLGINNPGDLFKYLQNRETFDNQLLEHLGRSFTLGNL